MTEEMLQSELVSLKKAYGDMSATKVANGSTLIRVLNATLPKGCSPAATLVLLTVPTSGRPTVHVKPGIKLSNGVVPRSTSIVSIEGEEWLQFSYNFAWDENSNSLVQFIGASLQRFAKLE